MDTIPHFAPLQRDLDRVLDRLLDLELELEPLAEEEEEEDELLELYRLLQGWHVNMVAVVKNESQSSK